MKRKLLLILLSIVLLSSGWLGFSGLPLLVALVPLLLISGEAEDSRRGWWSTFWWALAAFVGWNLATIWWIGNATLAGPIAATLFSSFYSIFGFMIYHTVSKRAPKALSYTVLVALWVALESYYMSGDFSWPWLLLGNGFSHDVWAVQWYEFTGIYGGSLWVLVSNVLLYEALRSGFNARRFVGWCVAVVVPLVVSLAIFWSYDSSSTKELEVAVVQPNVDSYDRSITDTQIEEHLFDLLADVPLSADVVLLSETILPSRYWQSSFDRSAFVTRLRNRMREIGLVDATIVAGVNTLELYQGESRPYTARAMQGRDGIYYDVFNSAAAITLEGSQLRNKSKLVIGVECTPKVVLDLFGLFNVDMGSITVGQIGKGGAGEAFDVDSTRIGVAICYEGLFGEFFGDFVRDGAQLMTIISNDCWWDNTPGYRQLYSISALRAVEYRRAIARCANTGISGFIDARGVSQQSMGWGEQGVMVRRVAMNDRMTFYAVHGDWVARISLLVAILSLLYYVSYRFRKRHYLVD
ncbi:MAG: apolipoprotein N-acyltransferase [Rikenellaceae bacterium]